jgi:hypothetical protein
VSTDPVCSVCGRTILKGERTRTYVTPEGDRRTVCELCPARAESLDWVWEEALGDRPHPSPPPRRRRRVLSGLLRGRAQDREEPAQPGEVASEEQDAEPEPGASPARSASPDPAAPGAGLRRAGSPQGGGSRLERAVSRFNRSEHARTVAGLIKTLGAPSVSVGTAAGSPSDVRITVAWELSWYQWGVDLREEDRPVHQIDKGHEIEQLDAPARHWNAHAEEDGSLRLGPAPAAAEGEPASAES